MEPADAAAVEEVHDTYQGEVGVRSPKSQIRDDHTDNADTVAVAVGSGGEHDDAVLAAVAADPKNLARALLWAALLEDGETHFDPEKGFDRQPW
jgi:hypothetical protein